MPIISILYRLQILVFFSGQKVSVNFKDMNALQANPLIRNLQRKIQCCSTSTVQVACGSV